MWYVYVIVAVFWVWGVCLAIHAINSGRTSQGTIAWILMCVFIPPVAIPAYYLFGDRRLEGYIRARRHGRRRIDRITKECLESLKSQETRPGDVTLCSLASLANYPWTRGNACGIFDTAEEMYDQLIRAIERASKYVLVQFFIYRDDTIGKRLKAALCAAAQRGVATYVMYDELGCSALASSYFEEIQSAGCHVSGFRTVPKRRRLLRLNFRNHRKLVVIDGETVFFGGMNIGDEYLDKGKNGEHWRDTHAIATGPCVTTAQLIFAEDWNWAQGSVMAGIEWNYSGKEVIAGTVAAEESLAAICNPVESMLMFPSGPIDTREPGVLLFLQLISRATTRLWIATPYLVCEESIVQAITLAKARGVDVRLLVPQKADGFVVGLAAESFMREFEAIDVRVYRYSKGFSHQKVVLSDNVSSIGSANLDHRSMKLNFELTGVIADARFADAIASMLAHDMKLSQMRDKDSVDQSNSLQRFAMRLARLAAPVL